MEGNVSFCNFSDTEGRGKNSVGLGGVEVHNSGWVNFVCVYVE
jgi:hypothetical protein